MTLIETEDLRAEVAPQFGARVVSLIDRRTGRQWLVPGAMVETPSYLAEAARGWDECFPTVSSCASAPRDHGDLWGRPVRMEGSEAIWDGPGWRFRRRLRAEGARLWARYRVENTGAVPLPWMWSQHLLVDPRPGDRIVLDGFDTVIRGGEPVDWPHIAGRDLTRCGGIEDGFAVKLYARARPGQVTAAVQGPDGGLALGWDGAAMPALGLWLDYGGWPPPPGAPVVQVALEPTTACADDLDSALTRGEGRYLSPGATEAWTITLDLTGPADT